MTALIVQGYALPWDRPAEVDGLVETCAPRAVAAETPRNITLLAGDHVDEGRHVYAQTKHRSLQFFQDDYGLGFVAYLDSESGAHHAVARAIARGEMCQCSVNFIDMRRRDDGRVIWGAIDHVAIVAQAAYPDTGCWLASTPVRERPAWLRDMSMTYMNSVIESSRCRPSPGGSPAASVLGRSLPSATRPTPAPRSHRIPASVQAFLDSEDFRIMAREQRRALQFMAEKPAGAVRAFLGAKRLQHSGRPEGTL